MRCIFTGIARDGNGNIVPSSTITPFLAGTATATSIYTTLAGAVAVNSVTAGADGSFSFYVDRFDYDRDQCFDIQISKTGWTTWTWYNVDIRDVVLGTYTISADKTVTTNLGYIPEGVLYEVATGKTLTISGSFDAGRYQVFNCVGTGKVVFGLGITAYPEWFGAEGDGLTDDTAALQAAAIAAPRIIIDKTYIAASTVTFALNDVELLGSGTVKTSGNGYTLLKFTGLRPRISGITVEGSATEAEVIGQTPNKTSLRKALIEINGEALTEAQSSELSGVTIRNAFETGLFLYKTVGAKVLNCTIQSDQTASLPLPTSPFVQAIQMAFSAIIQISNNNIRGYGEGTVIGTDGVTLIDLHDGSTPTTRTRKIIISGNIYTEQVDHSIYVSNYASEYKIVDNLLEAKLEPALKLEGDHLVVSGNSITQGIATRHIQSDAIISDNSIHIHSGNPYKYGILLSTSPVGIAAYTTMRNIAITGNSVTCDPGEQSRAGIAVQGLVDGAKQILLSDINISNNVVSGFGYNVSEASGIIIDQHLFPTNPVTGTKVLNTVISGNTIDMADVSGLATPNPTYGITLQRGFYGVVLSNNIIKNYTSTAVRSLGVSQMIANGNVLISKSVTSVATRYGFYERGHDTLTHYNSEYNTYGVNTFGGDGNTFDVYRADQSSARFDLKNLTVTLSANKAYDPPRYGYQAIYINMTAASKTITLSATGWWLNESCTIYNVGSNAFTVTNGTISKSVAVGANITFVHTGSNAYVTDK